MEENNNELNKYLKKDAETVGENYKEASKELLDIFLQRTMRTKSRIASCIDCGTQKGPLMRVNKLDKNKGFICKPCLYNIFMG